MQEEGGRRREGLEEDAWGGGVICRRGREARGVEEEGRGEGEGEGVGVCDRCERRG